jgi:hypothetical protein
MTTTETPSGLLDAARTLCRRSDAGTIGLWPRAAALVARQAVEAALAAYWDSRGTGAIVTCPMRTQLICFAELEGAELAGPVAAAWAALSAACHVHPYELAPTASELLAWMEDVQLFCGSAPVGE